MTMHRIPVALGLARILLMKAAIDTAADSFDGLALKVMVDKEDHFMAVLTISGYPGESVIFSYGMPGGEDPLELRMETNYLASATMERFARWIFGVPKIGEHIRRALVNDVGPYHYLARNSEEMFAVLLHKPEYRVHSTVIFPTLFMLNADEHIVRFVDLGKVLDLIKE